MTIDDQQAAAAKTDAPEDQDAKDADAQEDDLDSLLSEFDTETKAPKPESSGDQTDVKPETTDDTTNARLAAVEERFMREDVANAVGALKEGHPALAGISDSMIEARLRLEAENDPRFKNAFLNKAANPAAWDRVQESIGKKIAKEVGSPVDGQLTKDREAAVAAVNRNATSAPDAGPSNDDMIAMSDNQFEAHKAKLFRA